MRRSLERDSAHHVMKDLAEGTCACPPSDSERPCRDTHSSQTVGRCEDLHSDLPDAGATGCLVTAAGTPQDAPKVPQEGATQNQPFNPAQRTLWSGARSVPRSGQSRRISSRRPRRDPSLCPRGAMPGTPAPTSSCQDQGVGDGRRLSMMMLSMGSAVPRWRRMSAQRKGGGRGGRRRRPCRSASRRAAKVP